LFFLNRHQHYPELRANRIGLGENAHDFLWRSAGGDVIIRRLAAKQQIAHASAD